jgi:hypothetical protein
MVVASYPVESRGVTIFTREECERMRDELAMAANQHADYGATRTE